MILILDNYDSFTYNLYQAVAVIDKDVEVVRNDKISIEAIDRLSPQGIIISPGPGRPETAGISIDVVKQLGARIPILGICLGHQSIADAYGGEVVLAEKPVHGKPAEIFHQGKGLYHAMPMPFSAARYHSLIVEKKSLPDVLLVESESKEGIVMGLRHQEYPVFGVQFHPESILTPEGNRLIKNFMSMCHYD